MLIPTYRQSCLIDTFFVELYPTKSRAGSKGDLRINDVRVDGVVELHAVQTEEPYLELTQFRYVDPDPYNILDLLIKASASYALEKDMHEPEKNYFKIYLSAIRHFKFECKFVPD